MKNYLIILALFLSSTTLIAQNYDGLPLKGHYLFKDTGGFGFAPMATIGYENILPLNEYSFLSTKVGLNGAFWVIAFNYGVPHGVSINVGTRYVFLEAGVNGWYGYASTLIPLFPNGNEQGWGYMVGGNIGINTLVDLFDKEFMLRMYATPNYNLTNEVIREEVIWWGGLGVSFKL